ncbi:hypothetical protein [Anoxybacter fermentans]|nr:hypothetical protein [Anoxybacter fermentans]
MLLCLPCKKILLIRLKQKKSFWMDLCPECRVKVLESLKILKTG